MAVTNKLVNILGPTASGKSELALALAQRIGGEILSVDSMQVYRGMDIGTAKPTPDEQRAVRHHLVDVVAPDESFTVARFVDAADNVITSLAKDDTALIATGGTPLYFKALFAGMFDGPGEDVELRSRLRGLTNDELHRQLQGVDPPAAARIHLNDTKRLVRALEVYHLTGKPISSYQSQWENNRPRHSAVWVGLNWDREALNQRINARVKAMLSAGWVDEVRMLLDRYGQLSKTASEAAGYHELIEHVRGNLTLDEATEQIKISTRQLARRQMKWFRRFENVQWIDGLMPLEAKIERVLALL